MIHRTAIVLVVLAAIAGCQPTTPGGPAPPPTMQAATDYLSTVVDLVLAGRLTELCRLGSGTCAHTLRNSDPGAVPRTRPIVVGSRIEPSVLRPGGVWSQGGLVLQLCGLDGRGRFYRSEILVFNDGRRLIGKEPVFWVGLRIESGSTVGGPPPPDPPCPIAP
ncbi:MAG TPA: hypothetical protein VH813_06675 [Candidatus Limnocylindrales bacterium]